MALISIILRGDLINWIKSLFNKYSIMCKFYIVVRALVSLSSLFVIYVTPTSHRNYIYKSMKNILIRGEKLVINSNTYIQGRYANNF